MKRKNIWIPLVTEIPFNGEKEFPDRLQAFSLAVQFYKRCQKLRKLETEQAEQKRSLSTGEKRHFDIFSSLF